MNTGKIGMSVGIQPAEKQIVYPGAAKLARRQADAVYHQQRDIVGAEPRIVMGRGHLAGLVAPPFSIDGKLGCGICHRLLDSQWEWAPWHDGALKGKQVSEFTAKAVLG
jgi:hypothetical protein